MTLTSFKRSSINDDTRYVNMLVGNAAFNPSSYESIASATGTGSSASITFSSIPSTYAALQIRFNATSSNSGDLFQIRFNSDTGANYARHQFAANGTNVTSSSATGSSVIWVFGPRVGVINTSYMAAGVVDIQDYTSTSKYKTVKSLTGIDGNSSGEVDFMSGLWLSTSAINSITFLTNGGNFTTASTVSLYGIKGA
jgi:hypothetical protein